MKIFTRIDKNKLTKHTPIVYKQTKLGVITSMYSTQKSHSKKRNHNPPTYTKAQLSDWLLNDWLFDLLWNNWTNCGHISSMRPSLDRDDDSKGYSFDNIKLMTWGENNAKAHRDKKIGKLFPSKLLKAVSQFTKEGVFIRSFISTQEASRQTKSTQSCISACCNYKNNTSGGFIWRFTK